MRFSLVVATRSRVEEIGDFLESLLAQHRQDAEVLLVDQNGDDRLSALVERYAQRLPLRWIRSEIPNANNARNLGLSVAIGEIVGFPDDDCTYPPGLLNRIDAAFRDDPLLAVLTGPAAAPGGGLGSGRWRAEGGPITPENVWTSVIEFNLFLRRRTALALGGFDTRLGPGTRFGSAEGNDLVMRAIATGHRAIYDPEQLVVHPDKRLSEVAAARARIYGAGLGYVMRRHGVGPDVYLPFFIRPIGGALLSLARGDLHAAGYYAMTLRGRLSGFFAHGAAEIRELPPMRGGE
jgi:glycosyltransferase involved in cell wall biosynthesis